MDMLSHGGISIFLFCYFLTLFFKKIILDSDFFLRLKIQAVFYSKSIEFQLNQWKGKNNVSGR